MYAILIKISAEMAKVWC